MNNKLGVDSRKKSSKILTDVLEKSFSFEDAFQKSINNTKYKIRSEDKAFVYMLTSSVLRFLTQIDFTLDKLLKKSIKKLPDNPKMSLRIGLAQLFILKTPKHAAVSTSVDITKSKWKGLVNAILRQIIREENNYKKVFEDAPKLPNWLLKRWKKNWPNDYLKIIECIQEINPHIDVAVKRDIKKWKNKLGADLLPNNILRLNHGGLINEKEGYDQGEWWIQDYSSQIAIKSFSIKKNDEILDLCAAPGGKTAQMLALGAKVLSIDQNKKRIAKFKENMNRLKFKTEIIETDILKFETKKRWNKILLDVPCSSTGIIRKNPDILYSKEEGVINNLISIQKELLQKSWSLLNTGGQLLYCNCSLETEEGELQIKKFLENNPDAKINKISSDGLDDINKSLKKEGWLRILPNDSKKVKNIDGFFIACLKKVS
jgi:16S rRNA (cytosine967-C5)-methyltransferase|tara:strand:- start:66 stop:1355 length:1290 start_codon:yes stop_codon:yes gene_type:complete